jgi:hypothetical protein
MGRTIRGGVPALSLKDEQDLRWALGVGADMIALSLVRGRPQPRLPGGIPGERRVCPALQPLPVARPEPSVNGSRWPACIACLLPGDHPDLGLQPAAPAHTPFLFHTIQHEPARRPAPRVTPSLWITRKPIIVDRYLRQKKVSIHDDGQPGFPARQVGEIWGFVQTLNR